jgi:DNA-binding IclR family transcriptional regulator
MPIQPSPAVQRAGQVLWYLAEHPSKAHSISKIARDLEIPRATCDAIIQALTQQGFVRRRVGESGFELGASCLALSAGAQVANSELIMASRQAEELARELRACVAVSTVIAGEARAVAVFDRGPATMLRARVGLSISVTPPFGVVFVAWDQAASERWIASAAQDGSDSERFQDALEFARRHGYSYSVFVQPGEQFGKVLDELVMMPDSENRRRARDDLTGQLRKSGYLTIDIESKAEVQVLQITAPVFDSNGAVAASLMVVGSMRPMIGAEIEALGRRVVRAAEAATSSARDLRLGTPDLRQL